MNNSEACLVSICCLTYNHAPYIRQCFDGFVMQKTNFSFEILVHDDASSDNTACIIREYTEKFPDLFKPIYQTENKYSKGIWITGTFQIPRAKGKYIAMCEGDDYWIDQYKLQKQVDLLEKYSQASMCVALNTQININSGIQNSDTPYIGKDYPLIYFENLNKYFHTSTYLIRKSILEHLIERYRILFMGDTSWRYLLINEGPFVVLNEIVSVYRITNSGVWTSLNERSKHNMQHHLFHYFRLYHVPDKRKFYARNELVYLHSILVFKFKTFEYTGFINLFKDYLWLMFKYDNFFLLKIGYSNLKKLFNNILINNTHIPIYHRNKY